jgi:menaquinone-9 beta-reductase
VEDVAIIGAGPAGSTLAALLASRGVRVALYDRDAFPRDKLCGEFLSYDALPILDALGVLASIDAAAAPRITRCRVIGARTYEFELPHAARGVSRLFLDDLLLRTAIRNGAIFHQETVTRLDTLGAKIVVGAWGRWGRFDQQLGRGFVRDRSHRNFGFKRHFTGPATTSIDLYSFPRGYLGVNAVEGEITNICGLVHASRLAGHKGRWDAFVDTIRGEERELDQLFARYEPAQDGYLSSEPVIFRARSPVEGGVFMIGDASGVIDPLTGNGMAMAIQSALLAAPFIVRALGVVRASGLSAGGGPTLHDVEDEYRRAHRAFFAPRIAWSRRVAFLLSRPRLLDALLSIRSPRVGQLFLSRTRASREDVLRLAEAWFC